MKKKINRESKRESKTQRERERERERERGGEKERESERESEGAKQLFLKPHDTAALETFLANSNSQISPSSAQAHGSSVHRHTAAEARVMKHVHVRPRGQSSLGQVSDGSARGSAFCHARTPSIYG